MRSSSAAASAACRPRTSSTQRGLPFTLLEASPRLGGLIRTEHVDGFTIEAGPESVLAQKPAALRLCDELGLGAARSADAPAANAFVLRGGG